MSLDLRKLLARATVMALAGLLIACDSDGPTEPPVGEPRPADVGGYMAGLPSWSSFAPELSAEDVPTGDPSDPDVFTVGAVEYTCTTTPYSITRTPDRIAVFNPDSEILWLGGLLQGKGHRDGLGSLAELPIRQRAPVTVFIDLLSENVTRTVENPDPSSVAAAIGELVAQAAASGHKAGSTTFFDQKETYNLRQASLELGISARYLGTTVTSKLSYEESREERTLTAYFVQRMFTSSMVLPQTPGAVFSEAFTQERLDEQVLLGRMGEDNLPTFVSNIVWGRMLMVTMTSTHSVEDMKAALNASNDAIGSGSVASEHLQVLQESEIRVSAVGGSDEGVANLIRSGQLRDYFDPETELSLTQARPLSYTVRNLADNSIAVVSETTEYNLRECATADATPTGASYKLTLDRLSLIADGCDGAFSPSPEVYYSFSLHTDAGTRTIISRPSNAAVSISEGGSHTLPFNENVVDLYAGGSSMRITGSAWDHDSNSVDERIGSWDLSYGYGTSNGQRYFTRSENGCSIRLYLTITKEGDLYGSPAAE